jgi:hypothetical protein
MERESYLRMGRSGRGLKQMENLDRASGQLERLLCHREATINPGNPSFQIVRSAIRCKNSQAKKTRCKPRSCFCKNAWATRQRRRDPLRKKTDLSQSWALEALLKAIIYGKINLKDHFLNPDTRPCFF